MGFSFAVTQSLLIRELLVAFFGNELSIGLTCHLAGRGKVYLSLVPCSQVFFEYPLQSAAEEFYTVLDLALPESKALS